MDFSQLPKMSDTPKPPPPEKSEASDLVARPVEFAPVDGTFGFASIWISLVVGAILMMLGANFGRWATATLSGTPFQTNVNWTAGPKEGQMVEYFDLQGGTAWSEAGLFLMGVALLLDAGLMFVFYRRGTFSSSLLYAAIFVTGIALAINVFVAAKLFGLGVMPMITMCAVLGGGILLFDHFALLSIQKRMPSPRPS